MLFFLQFPDNNKRNLFSLSRVLGIAQQAATSLVVVFVVVVVVAAALAGIPPLLRELFRTTSGRNSSLFRSRSSQ